MQYFVKGRDGQVMNRDRLIEEAKRALSSLADGYAPRSRQAKHRVGMCNDLVTMGQNLIATTDSQARWRADNRCLTIQQGFHRILKTS